LLIWLSTLRISISTLSGGHISGARKVGELVMP
jgi:hypothetical protein